MGQKTAEELRRELEDTLIEQQHMEDKRRYIETKEESIDSFMRRYRIICEEMKEAYQGETSNQILGKMEEDGWQVEKDMRNELDNKREEIASQYRRLHMKEVVLGEEYKRQVVREEKDATIN